MKRRVCKILSIILLVALVPHPTGTVAQTATDPISDQEVNSYIKWLRADADQATVIRGFHDDYKNERQTRWLPILRDFYARGMKEYEVIQKARYPRAELIEELYGPLRRELKPIQSELDALDTLFYTNMASVLTTEQLLRMARVHNGRKRVLYSRRQAGELPEGRVDLIALIDSLQFDQPTQDRLDEFISEFEPRWIAAIKDSDEAVLKQREGYIEVNDLRALSAQTEAPEAQQRLTEKIRRLKEKLGRPRVAASKRSVALNRLALLRLQELLEDEQYAAVERQFLHTAYPSIYPDVSSAHRLYESALDIYDLRVDQRVALLTLFTSYQMANERLSKKMAESLHDRRWTGLAGQPYHGRGNGDLWREILALGVDRENLNARQIVLIRPTLTPEQFLLLPEWDFVANPRARPWDPVYQTQWETDQEERKRK